MNYDEDRIRRKKESYWYVWVLLIVLLMIVLFFVAVIDAGVNDRGFDDYFNLK